jgi:hypothetical protein
MIARTVSTVLVFPFIRAKVMLQAGKSRGETKSLLVLLLQMWQREGVAGLYQGLGPELTRGVLSSALMLMIKEKVAVLVRQMILANQQKRRQELVY